LKRCEGVFGEFTQEGSCAFLGKQKCFKNSFCLCFVPLRSKETDLLGEECVGVSFSMRRGQGLCFPQIMMMQNDDQTQKVTWTLIDGLPGKDLSRLPYQEETFQDLKQEKT
jgi:hypothetical protein